MLTLTATTLMSLSTNEFMYGIFNASYVENVTEARFILFSLKVIS